MKKIISNLRTARMALTPVVTIFLACTTNSFIQVVANYRSAMRP